MKILVFEDKNFEGHSLFVKFVRIFTVPILNNLPARFLQRFMKLLSYDIEIILDNVGSANRRNLFAWSILQSIGDLFWHHFVSRPKNNKGD